MNNSRSRSFVTGETGDDYILPWSGRGLRYTEEDIKAVVDVMKGEHQLTQGEKLVEFEDVFSKMHENLYAFAASSGAASLELTALLLNIQQGDEIIIPAHTYVASAIPYARQGAKIVWADIEPNSRVISVESIEKLITPKTKSVVIVHLYGLHTPMEEIVNLCNSHNITIIEDCAQSLGATYNNKICGTHGHMACFSFHAQKIITTLGEGGMLLVSSDEYAKAIPGLRHNGHKSFPKDRTKYWIPAMVDVDFSYHNIWPYNFSIGEAQCALGISLLSRLEDLNSIRYSSARQIVDSLSGLNELEFQEIPKGCSHVYHLLCAKYKNNTAKKGRNDLIDLLASEYKIQSVVQYYPLYRYPLFKKSGFGDADCPNTDEFFDNMISFPFYEWYSQEQINYLITSISAAVKSLRV